MIKIIKLNLIFTLVTLTLIYCTKTEPDTPVIPPNTDCTVSPTYTKDIAPIINSSCAIPSCHNATSRKDGRDYSTYALTKAGATSSSFLGSIQHQSGYKAMPENAAKLSNANITLIICWIKNGYPQ